MEPLPFREMGKYGEPFPDTVEMREYRERWLTRVVYLRMGRGERQRAALKEALPFKEPYGLPYR